MAGMAAMTSAKEVELPVADSSAQNTAFAELADLKKHGERVSMTRT